MALPTHAVIANIVSSESTDVRTIDTDAIQSAPIMTGVVRFSEMVKYGGWGLG